MAKARSKVGNRTGLSHSVSDEGPLRTSSACAEHLLWPSGGQCSAVVMS